MNKINKLTKKKLNKQVEKNETFNKEFRINIKINYENIELFIENCFLIKAKQFNNKKVNCKL